MRALVLLVLLAPSSILSIVAVEGLVVAPTTIRTTKHNHCPSARNHLRISLHGRPCLRSSARVYARTRSVRIRNIHGPSSILHTSNDNNNNIANEGISRNMDYFVHLVLGRRGGTHHTGFPLRLLSISTVMISSFATYLLGTAILNRTIVDRLGVSRGGDAFGPFATLLSLIYSIVLGQIYHYYFERQQIIQNCLYEEAAALQLLFHTVGGSPRATSKQGAETQANSDTATDNYDPARRSMLAFLKAYTQNFLRTAFSTKSSYKLRQDVPQKLVEMASIYDNTSSSSSSHGLLVANAIQAATSARALRISHVNSDLPVVQKITERLLSYVILGGYVLVDLKAPILEALLFSVLAGCFTTIHGFLMDLSDPFSGQWTVGTHIRKDLEDLVSSM